MTKKYVFQKSYWFPKKSSSGVGLCPNRRENKENFEPVPDRLVPGISVFDLTKEYKSVTSGTVLAVDNINIDFYSGEISALLGHNGAGKTSVFSMIAGMNLVFIQIYFELTLINELCLRFDSPVFGESNC